MVFPLLASFFALGRRISRQSDNSATDLSSAFSAPQSALVFESQSAELQTAPASGPKLTPYAEVDPHSRPLPADASWQSFAERSRALLDDGRIEDARRTLELAAGTFPTMAAPWHDLARLAEHRRDWADAERCWRELLARDDRPWWAHIVLAGSLREQGRLDEAEQVLIAAQERLPQEVSIFAEYARLAEVRRDWESALSRWANVATRFPESWQGDLGRASALATLDRQDEAIEVLRTAVARFPGERRPWHDLAWLAERRHDWPEAERCWRMFIGLDDRHWRGITGLASALEEQGRPDEADQVLAAAQERLPHELAVFADHARLAERRKDWATALHRWEAFALRFPETWQGDIGRACALAALDQQDEAVQVLEAAAARFPTATPPVRELARLAERRGHWAEAGRCWREVLARDDREAWVHTSLASALHADRRFHEADEVLIAAALRFPDDSQVLSLFARNAELREDWLEALIRWEAIQARFPELTNASERVGAARAQLLDDKSRIVPERGGELRF